METLITLFEGDYHVGAAALINSLHRAGFAGTVVCGHRGPRPPWASHAERLGCRVVWEDVTTSVHLTNYKPVFLKGWLERHPETAMLAYADPDLVVKAPWSVISRWAVDGVALVEDVNGYLPARHPYRLQWQDLFRREGLRAVRESDRYYNAGFIALAPAHDRLLEVWSDLVRRSERQAGTLGNLKNRQPHDLFHSADQDALNMALMLTDVPVNGVGPEGMDFTPGGHLLSHAIGPAKPWRGGFLRRAFHGYPPSLAVKAFHDYADGPLPALPPGLLRRRKIDLRLAAFVGRFYRRG